MTTIVGRAGYVEYDNVNEYIRYRPDIFSGKCCFGTNIWEMYAEIWSARHDPALKILVYEGLLLDKSNEYMDHLPILSDFLGTRNDHSLFKKVAPLVSKEEMLKHVDKFDDRFIAEQGKKLGRAVRIMEPAAKVTVGKDDGRVELSDSTIEWLEDRWLERMTPITGHGSYDAFAADLSDLLLAEPDNNSTATQFNRWSSSSRQFSRRSSITVAQMPALRSRRDSLSPDE